MEIRPKSPELVQAQIAAFASEVYDDTRGKEKANDKEHILSNLGSLTVGDVTEVSRVTQGNEYDLNELTYTAGVQKTVATRQQYVDYLRGVGGSSHDTISNRGDMLGAYAGFKPQVDKIKDETRDIDTRKSHPAYIANGSNSYAYSVYSEGVGYVARIPNKPKASIVDGYVEGAVLGRGVPHLEQVTAMSYEDGVTISEIMHGKPLDKKMSAEEASSITDEHLAQLVDTLVTADERGIKIDPKPDNFFYDSTEGFGVIDYSAHRPGHERVRPGELVGELGQSFMQIGFFGRTAEEGRSSVEDYVRDSELLKADLAVLERYRMAVVQKLEGKDLSLALDRINQDIEQWQAVIENYSNPEWVSKEISGENAKALNSIDPSEVW